MVAAYHLIWTIYGAWLPNDPRGSNSTELRSRLLQELGEIHFGRKKIQPTSNVIRKFYAEAKPRLKHDVIPFTEDEVLLIAEAFSSVMKSRRYTCYACAIMPDHVHLVIRKHRDKAEAMIAFLQDESWLRIIDAKNRPSDHPVWTTNGWKVFLDTCEEIERTIRYIRANPVKANLPEQIFDFVQQYDGWLPGIGAKKN